MRSVRPGGAAGHAKSVFFYGLALLLAFVLVVTVSAQADAQTATGTAASTADATAGGNTADAQPSESPTASQEPAPAQVPAPAASRQPTATTAPTSTEPTTSTAPSPASRVARAAVGGPFVPSAPQSGSSRQVWSTSRSGFRPIRLHDALDSKSETGWFGFH